MLLLGSRRTEARTLQVDWECAAGRRLNGRDCGPRNGARLMASSVSWGSLRSGAADGETADATARRAAGGAVASTGSIGGVMGGRSRESSGAGEAFGGPFADRCWDCVPMRAEGPRIAGTALQSRSRGYWVFRRPGGWPGSSVGRELAARPRGGRCGWISCRVSASSLQSSGSPAYPGKVCAAPACSDARQPPETRTSALLRRTRLFKGYPMPIPRVARAIGAAWLDGGDWGSGLAQPAIGHAARWAFPSTIENARRRNANVRAGRIGSRSASWADRDR